MAVEYKLAAILSADVVGYSRLMADNEDATVRTLSAYRDEIGLLVEQHTGRVVDFTGDNLLAQLSKIRRRARSSRRPSLPSGEPSRSNACCRQGTRTWTKSGA